MIRPKRNWIVSTLFGWYIRRIVEWNFHRVEQCGSLKESDKAILLLSNHVGWWDGFWALYLNDTYLHRRFHAMMLEGQLRKYGYLRYLGGFSVQKQSRSIVESLDYASALLKQPENLVLLFPQGKIGSQQRTDIPFEKGAERILDRTDRAQVQVLFLVCLTDYGSHKKPVLSMYLEEYHGSHQTAAMNAAFNAFYQASRNLQSKKEA